MRLIMRWKGILPPNPNHPEPDGIAKIAKAGRAAQQIPPEIIAGIKKRWFLRWGRGGGKTYTSAVNSAIFCLINPGIRFGVTARTHDDLMQTIFRENLLDIIPEECIQGGSGQGFNAQAKTLTLYNGSVIRGFTGMRPDGFRGPNLHGVWFDELPAYQHPQETYDMAMMATRKTPPGGRKLIIISTTPRKTKQMKKLSVDPGTFESVGSTYDNSENLDPDFIQEMEDRYGGTRLGRQELLAEILEDETGPFRMDWIEDNRMKGKVEKFKTTKGGDDYRLAMPDKPPFESVCVAIDPAVTSNEDSDMTGIVVVGRAGNRYYVLEDATMKGRPNEWANKAVAMYKKHNANLMVVEGNNGGENLLVPINNASGGSLITTKLVRAKTAKLARAESVGMLYEQGKVVHWGTFAELEDQMCEFTGMASDISKSPDRMDALVWAILELGKSSPVYWGRVA